jgi:sulfur-carrier protein
MAQIEVSVPGLLRDCTGGVVRFPLEAPTLDEAITSLVTTYPLLRLHLYDEQERLRSHVLLYFNEENVAWLENRNLPLKSGDRLAVLQNVSGG